MLDKNSKKIVRALESDARMSFAALGDEIGTVSYTHLTLPTTPYV